MKKFKTTIILVLVLIALGGFILIFERPAKKKEASPLQSKSISVKKEDAKKIEITKGEEKVILKKQDGEWFLQGEKTRRAHQSLVNNIFEKFSGLMVGDVVSTNPEKQFVFQVDEASSVKLVVFGESESKMLDLYIGKRGQTAESNYIRYNGEDKVYSAKKYILNSLDLPVGQWLDKTIVKFDKEKLESLKIKVAEKEAIISKKEDAWVKTVIGADGDIEADQEKIDAIIEIFSDFQGLGFVESVPKEFDITIILKLTESGEQVLEAVKKASKGFIRLSGSEDVFEVEASVLDDIIEMAG